MESTKWEDGLAKKNENEKMRWEWNYSLNWNYREARKVKRLKNEMREWRYCLGVWNNICYPVHNNNNVIIITWKPKGTRNVCLKGGDGDEIGFQYSLAVDGGSGTLISFWHFGSSLGDYFPSIFSYFLIYFGFSIFLILNKSHKG